ncbi:MAG TPA: hypothetical protein VH762_15355 [Gemmatimonadaceae bacterium]
MPIKLINSARRRPSAAPYMLLATAIGALFLLFAAPADQPLAGEGESRALESKGSISVAATVNAFSAFATEQRLDDSPVPSAYVAEGISRLAAVLNTLANMEAGLPPARYASAAAELTEAAYIIDRPEREAMHGETLRNALRSATGVLAELQRDRYPELANDISDLQEATRTLRDDRPLTTQTVEVQRCFDRANVVLRGMIEEGL